MSRRNYARIQRLTKLGLILSGVIILIIVTDFIYALTADTFHIPYLLQMFSVSDPIWALKFAALMAIAVTLASLEDLY